MLSYRKLAMRVLGRPLHTEGIDSPRPASQRAAAFALTAAMLITLTAPAFAETWYIENGDITVKASGTEGKNTVSQGNKKDVEDTNTIITNQKTDTASSNTVTIEAGNDKVEVTLKDVNIDVSKQSKAAVSVTGSGNTTIKLDGDNHLTGGNGIYSNSRGSLTISGDENDSLTAQGGDSRNGIYSVSGDVTISGGTVTATGGNSTSNYGSGGDGIHSGSLTISGGTVTATGGDSTSSVGSGGSGIYSVSGDVTISGGTVNANGGNGNYGNGGDGILSFNHVAISGGTVNANGGNSDYSNGGNGIHSNGVTISGGTVKANGGNGNSGSSNGGNGIISFDHVAISGGTVNAAGGNGGNGSRSDVGNGIISSVIDLSGSLELTAKAGSPNGKALSRVGSELDLNTIKDKLDPGAKVTATDADGKVIQQVSIPRPVEPEEPVIPEESSSSSDGGSATPSAPASPLPGLTVTDKDGQRISYTSIRDNNVLSLRVGRFTASLHISLAALRQLRAEGIETITFQTILCSTTLSVDELLAMGGEDAEVVLTHHIRSSTLTVGGKAV